MRIKDICILGLVLGGLFYLSHVVVPPFYGLVPATYSSSVKKIEMEQLSGGEFEITPFFYGIRFDFVDLKSRDFAFIIRVFGENGDLKFESKVDFSETESEGNSASKRTYEFIPLSWAITKECLRKGKLPFFFSADSHESDKLNQCLVAFREKPIFPILPWTRQPLEKCRIEILPVGNHCGKYEFAYWYAHYFS